MILLKKQFSREKSLIYFCMWDRSDRAGYARFAGHEVQHNLFHLPGSEEKVHVYYSDEEMAALFGNIEDRFTRRPQTWQEMVAHLEETWENISPYVERELSIETVEAFLEYFQHLTDWWTAMTVVFFLPDVKSVDEEVRLAALGYRERGEKYTEIVHRAMETFWRVHLPQELLDVALVVTPEELAALVRREVSLDALKEIRKRLEGYGLFNGKVYSLEELQRVLLASNVRLVDDEADGQISEVRGITAQPGLAVGPARVVIKKADLQRVQMGDVIVAEMTNPDYVPWMKTAAAFVTDEGGMTCHAGIVARELGKPCVVGTKIATKVFRDGEMLEVDATNGIVRRV